MRWIRNLRLVLALAALFATPCARAHEFWLEPTDFVPKPGESVAISILVGEKFKGNTYPFLREEFKKFVVVDGRGERPVKGIDGDDPALTMKFPEPGLAILAHHSMPAITVFETWERFQLYLDFEGLQHIAALHLQAGKRQDRIRESYSRCAKLLIGVGAPQGGDRLTGMPLELVAERNPYSLKAGEDLPVRLYLHGQPVAGVQISAISKIDPDKRLLARTDSEGRANIALPQAGSWLLNAVHILPPAAGEDADWTSLWASMTFARP